VDEERKIDLNTLSIEHIDMLRAMLEELCDMREGDAEVVAQAILDFTDPDLTVLNAPIEPEMEYYTEWAWRKSRLDLPEGWTFRPKNDFFLGIEELLDIPGIGREALYGDPQEVPSDPIERIDWQEESPALIDYLTVGTSGKVNINTCGDKLLHWMFVGASHNMIDVRDAATRVVRLREDLRRDRGLETQGFADVSQLAEAEIDPALLAALQSLFPMDVRSHTFRIVSRGEVGGVRETIEARVNIEMQIYPIDPEDPDTFGKRDDRASGWLKDQPNLKVDPSVFVIRQSEL